MSHVPYLSPTPRVPRFNVIQSPLTLMPNLKSWSFFVSGWSPGRRLGQWNLFKYYYFLQFLIGCCSANSIQSLSRRPTADKQSLKILSSRLPSPKETNTCQAVQNFVSQCRRALNNSLLSRHLDSATGRGLGRAKNGVQGRSQAARHPTKPRRCERNFTSELCVRAASYKFS